MAVFCTRCGLEATPDHRFCHACGQALESAAVPVVPGGTWGAVRKTGQWIMPANAVATFLTATLGVVCDILAPIGPVLGLLALALTLLWSLSALVRTLVPAGAPGLGRLPRWLTGATLPVWRDRRFWLTGVLVAGICAFALASNHARAQGGAVASLSKPLQDWQRQIGLLHQGLADIRAEQQVGNLLLQEGNANSRDIERNTALAKRESSEDPRKELANIGVAWKIDNFEQALQTGDLRTARLFIRGGMPPNRHVVRYMVMKADRDTAELFVTESPPASADACRAAMNEGFASRDDRSLLPIAGHGWAAWRKVCRGEELRSALQANMTSAGENRVNGSKAYVTARAEYLENRRFVDGDTCTRDELAFWRSLPRLSQDQVMHGSANRVALHYPPFFQAVTMTIVPPRVWSRPLDNDRMEAVVEAVKDLCDRERAYYGGLAEPVDSSLTWATHERHWAEVLQQTPP